MASIWKTEKYTAKNGKIYQRYAVDANGNKQLKDDIDPATIDPDVLSGAKRAPRKPRVPKEPVEEYKLIDLSNKPIERLIPSTIHPGLVFRMRRSTTGEYLGYRVIEKIKDFSITQEVIVE
jgi:hypothetical protein